MKYEEKEALLSKDKSLLPWRIISGIVVTGLLLSVFLLLTTTAATTFFYLFFFGQQKITIESSHDLIESRSIVKLTVPNYVANQLDWIGVYCPPDSLDNAPLQWAYINGTYVYEFDLVNFRSDYEIRLFKNQTYEILAKKTLQVNKNYPTQIHLSYTEKQNEIRVMWISGYSGQSSVVYYEEGTTNSKVEYGTVDTYNRTDMCHSPANETYSTHGRAWLEPGYIHNVVLKNLSPKKKYFYKVGHELHGYSEEYSFRAPRNFDDHSTISFIHFGDLGSYINGWTTPRHFSQKYNDLYMEEQNWPSLYTLRQINNEMNKNEIDFLFHNGDISYSYGYLYGWDYFGFDTQNISARIPYMVSIGNHEYGYFGSPFHTNWTYYDGEDSGGECGVPFLKRFDMPNANGGAKNLWFSYNYGSVHVIVLSLEHDFTKNSEQYNWIKKDLLENNSTWTILFSHRPMYVSASLKYVGDNRMAKHIQIELEDILLGKVDLFIAGHYHAYERTCKMENYKCSESNGITHVLVGAAGYLDEYPFREPKPEWSIVREQIVGYSIVHANSTHLDFQYLATNGGKLLDQFILKK